MMAGGVTGGQAPSSLHAATTNSLSANDHLNEDDLFMHSNASDLLPYDFSSANSVSNHTKKRNDEMTSQTRNTLNTVRRIGVRKVGQEGRLSAEENIQKEEAGN